MIIPILDNDSHRKQNPISQKDIKHKKFGSTFKYDEIVLNLKFTELAQKGQTNLGGLFLRREGCVTVVWLVAQLWLHKQQLLHVDLELLASLDYCYAGEVRQGSFYQYFVRCFIVRPAYVVFFFQIVQYFLDQKLVPDQCVTIDDLYFLILNFKIITIIVLHINLYWCALIERENILTLDKAKIINNKFQILLLTKLYCILLHFKILTNGI